jgi:putative hydrolases of HD superfamily
MEQQNPHNVTAVVNMLFEMGIMAKTPRSGFHFLGTGHQSVAEHVHRNAMIGLALGLMDGTVDTGKLVQMCLLHDIAEARTSDLNYVHQKYVSSDEAKAFEDLASTLPFGDQWRIIMHEYKDRKSQESLLAKDADNLEWILSLKEQDDLGNTRAREWIVSAVARLKTDVAKQLAQQILVTRSDAWWFTGPNDDWFINRTGKPEPGSITPNDRIS